MENTGNIDFFVFGDFSKCYFQEINLKFKQDFFEYVCSSYCSADPDPHRIYRNSYFILTFLHVLNNIFFHVYSNEFTCSREHK